MRRRKEGKKKRKEGTRKGSSFGKRKDHCCFEVMKLCNKKIIGWTMRPCYQIAVYAKRLDALKSFVLLKPLEGGGKRFVLV